MNGESVFGWLKVIAVLGVLALVAIGGLLIWRWIEKKGGLGAATVAAGVALKENTPLGIPARGIDAGISAATGREETLGGFFAELFDPSTRQLARELRSDPPPPSNDTSDLFSLGAGA